LLAEIYFPWKLFSDKFPNYFSYLDNSMSGIHIVFLSLLFYFVKTGEERIYWNEYFVANIIERIFLKAGKIIDLSKNQI
jgi:hypothetical protein